jgi:hypothetical protein
VLIGDVGGSQREEVDRVPFAAAAGRNYGWNLCEGDVGAGCADPAFTAPVIALPREDGFSGVIGGFVVRDPGVPGLLGRYLFADLGQPTAWSADLATAEYHAEPGLPAGGPRSFGEDGCGRVHLATAGAVYRLAEAASDACLPPAPPPGGTQPPPPPPPPPPSADTTAPTVRVRPGRRRLRALVVKLRADEACRATVRARGYRSRAAALDAGVTRRVRLAATPRTVRRLRARHRVFRTVRVTVVDAAGNSSRRAPRLRVR